MTAVPIETDQTPNPLQIAEVAKFICAHWDDTVRYFPDDVGTLVGLPHPFTVPCRDGAFQELYYWDTYFTCAGLVASGRVELASGNALDLLAQVARFGYVPNANRTYCLTRSQPPYLAPLVKLVADAAGEPGFLRDAVPLIEREYRFWTTQRQSPTGLSHYGHHASREELIEFFPSAQHRLGVPDARTEDNLDCASHALAECESGWDFNSRFEQRCADFCPVDLNSNLYLYETMLAASAPEADRGRWEELARRRRDQVNTLCWDDELGGFFDYDHVNRRRSRVVSVAGLQPLWAGLADERQAEALVRNILPQLEFAFGVSAVATAGELSPFQWDHPRGWPCIQYLVYRGLDRYGYHQDARRIAGKYLETVCRTFAETGDLWEKYNVLDGTHRTAQEAGYYGSPVDAMGNPGPEAPEIPPAMMGWTAGTFMDAAAFLER